MVVLLERINLFIICVIHSIWPFLSGIPYLHCTNTELKYLFVLYVSPCPWNCTYARVKASLREKRSDVCSVPWGQPLCQECHDHVSPSPHIIISKRHFSTLHCARQPQIAQRSSSLDHLPFKSFLLPPVFPWGMAIMTINFLSLVTIFSSLFLISFHLCQSITS